MPKVEGSIKTGGRQKGTPNKKTQLLNEILDAKDFCIPEKLMELLPSLSPEKQADVLVDLMSYVYPKRKAIEQLNVNAGYIDINSLSREQVQDLHNETNKKLFGYDIMNAEQRAARIDQLDRALEVTASSTKIIRKPSRNIG
ncbi:hypothetical protein [Bdellovibrio sp. KM01]|uniref:hypothetical protein n=1 Tax=Bdellovibrio sp. KM01 TaxID=2748865 RepID=UPI0015E9B979|nr:hypothetical protein [Bdellovibrio sp. KM01]QLY25698.1 hypothetical protein HW988_01195 [Bdellovibrio sp. KM01]